MSSRTTAAQNELSRAEALPQLDASSLVDAERLEAEVKDMSSCGPPAWPERFRATNT